MANLSQIKRQKMLDLLAKIKEEHKDDDETLIALGEIENELTSKKYGLVWEKHEEEVDRMMKDNIPVFTEVPEREICAASDKGYNFLLEGDNLHSLKLLEKTHKGKIDVIYIDPPYNTGSNDFIYDDKVVDKNDGFLHSKWISFIYARLKIASNLLSSRGVLAISIGYQEVHNLFLLCQELFSPQRQVVCVTVQTSGGKPNSGFMVKQEHIIFVTPLDFSPNPSEEAMNEYASPYHGMNLATFNQIQRPNQAYPIFINEKGIIVGCGKSLAERIKTGEYKGNLGDFVFDYSEAPEGTVAIWPVTKKGDPCVWRLIPERLMSDWKKGYIKVIAQKKGKVPFAVQYLSAGVIEKVESGEFESYKISEDPSIPTIDVKNYYTGGVGISTIWTDTRYYTTNGSDQIKEIFGKKGAFSYPKPLELVYNILQRTTSNDSIVLDFFAGSGTTAQAVVELNKLDEGNRTFILCTNNENKICETVTLPRIETVISGKRADGSIYSEDNPSNLMYYRTDFVSKNEEYLSDSLNEHIKEMIQLEHGVKVDDVNYKIILTDEDADELEKNIKKYKDLKAIYLSRDVLLTTKQLTLFKKIQQYIIPDYYFEFELKEAGQAW